MLPLVIALLFLPLSVFSGPSCPLPDRLERLSRVNGSFTETVPVTYNHLLQGGYFNMPSARMGCEGELGVGYSNVPPYRNYNLRFQFNDWIELSGNYRIFCGVDDPILSPHGFGDFSDKGVNVKIALLRPEESDNLLPGIAFGLEDFLGTKAFNGTYLVATKLFPSLNLEASLGFGPRRWSALFGGLTWFPFYRCSGEWLRPLALVAEWDSIDYEDPDQEPHPRGRVKHSPINWGLKWRWCEWVDFSVSRIRGDRFAASLSASYNFGREDGFFPRIRDPLPFRSYSPSFGEDPFDLVTFLCEQGFEVLEMWQQQKGLYLRVHNLVWRKESEVKMRLCSLLAYLLPNGIDQVTVALEGEGGCSVQEYRFCRSTLEGWRAGILCPYEMGIFSCRQEATLCPQGTLLLHRSRSPCEMQLFPRIYSFFGSAKGKYKYSAGVNLSLSGFLYEGLFYQLLLGLPLISRLDDLSDIDRLNPSQLINVRTDSVRYLKQRGLIVDAAYLQQTNNLSQGWFWRLAAGLFEEMYGGVATEVLYYPARSRWAVGLEAAILRKRTLSGIGFTDKIRKLEGFIPTFEPFLGSQAFATLYADLPELSSTCIAKGGRFLARDWGVRLELQRNFCSGLQVWAWYTMTNGRDKVNGHTYFDQGVGISLPLEHFYTYSSRKRWSWSMAAWLRDVGAIAASGNPLYEMIKDQRRD